MCKNFGMVGGELKDTSLWFLEHPPPRMLQLRFMGQRMLGGHWEVPRLGDRRDFTSIKAYISIESTEGDDTLLLKGNTRGSVEFCYKIICWE